jgi:hypothetical protein
MERTRARAYPGLGCRDRQSYECGRALPESDARCGRILSHLDQFRRIGNRRDGGRMVPPPQGHAPPAAYLQARSATMTTIERFL